MMDGGCGLLETIQKYKHAVIFPMFSVVYMYFFAYLEKTVVTKYNVIHMRIDDFIPFCEFFVVPYLLWFLFIGTVFVYLVFSDSHQCLQLSMFLMAGMTIFLVVSFFYPNGHHLRPTTFVRDNIFVDLVKDIYRLDTPTNILPSLHVFNTLGVQISISRNERLVKNRFIFYGSCILSALIVMSTLFLRQHSLLDVISAFVLAYVFYVAIYRTEYGPEYSQLPAHR